MSRRLPIRVVRSAADQIAEAAAWWDVNRPKAPAVFRQEMERAFEIIAVQPRIGAKAGNVKLAGCVVSISVAFTTTSIIE